MPMNGYNIGRDVTLSIVTAGNGTLNFNKITGFQSKQNSTDQEIPRLDGITDILRFYKPWTGSFTIERQDAVLDNYFAQLEANFYIGAVENGVSITETIQEVSGALTQWRFQNVLLKYDDAGDYRSDKSVSQAVSFLASRRIKIA
jgi:hypothetical protein